MRLVIKVPWVEYERGWGQRPDGYSLHLNVSDAHNFINEYWAKQPPREGGMAPDEYSAPEHTSAWDIVEVTDETYEKVSLSKNGIREYK